MSYHILHISTPNCSLYTDKGLFFCEYDDGSTNKIAIADIKAIVVATYGVNFTNHCLAKLLENDIVILHCNKSYQPTGWSLPLERTVRTRVFYNQIAQNKDFEIELWKKILKQKVNNQAQNLDIIGCKEHNLYKLIERPLISEANIAKQYWQKYFLQFNRDIKREHENAQEFENICLNYGYAIFNTLIYRSLIIHGMLASLGIHHEEKYKSTPLVYDLIEPYRAFVDYYLHNFFLHYPHEYKNKNLKAWSKYVAECLKNYRLKINDTSYKILDIIDIYVEKIAESFINFDCKNIFLPELKKQYLYIDKQRNREYEE